MITNLKSRPQPMTRRAFLGWALGISLLGLFGQAGTALFQFFKPRVEPGTFGGKVVAGQVGEFQPGTVSHVPKGRFYISRLEDGGLLALFTLMLVSAIVLTVTGFLFRGPGFKLYAPGQMPFWYNPWNGL